MTRIRDFISEHDYACWCGARSATLVCAQMVLGQRRFAVLECSTCQTQRILPKAFREHSAAAILYNEYKYPDFSDADLTRFTQITLQRLQETQFRFENGLRVLDVGCGSGVLLEAICSRYGCIGHGIDVDRRCINKALAHSTHATFECGLFKPSPACQNYDIVISAAVIEHVPDPVGFLRELGQTLTANGSLFLVTPNARSLNYRILRTWWRELLSIGEHIYLFAPESLNRCASLAGFKLIKCSSGFDWGFRIVPFNSSRNCLISIWAIYREIVKRICSCFASTDRGDILYAHFRKVS